MLYSLSVPLWAQEPAFQPGERISYTVFYSVAGLYASAGTATITTSQTRVGGTDAYHIVGEGRTNARYNWIYKVRDRYESYVDAETLQPLRFIRHIEEGDYRKHEEIRFNPAANTATTSKGVYPVPDEVHDVVSSLFYARNINYNKFKVGEKVTFKMFLDHEVFDMYVRYAGKETIKTRYGTFRTIKLKPLLIKGKVFNGGEQMTVWITDDPNHIPVRIETPLTVGSIKVDLMKYSNLKYPLSSLSSVR